MNRDWRAFGFGIAVKPFWWQLGHVAVGREHYFNIGPIAFAWKWPTPRETN